MQFVPFDAWPRAIRAEYERLLTAEEEAFRDADAVFCVSEAMRTHFRRKYSIAEDRLAVVPCCVPSERFISSLERRNELRISLGLQQHFVVAYVGSLAWYQLPEQSIRAFKIIKEIRSDAHFLVLTTEPEKMQSLLRSSNVSNEDITVMRVPPAQVPNYLSVADLGLLLRENSIVNRVSSPVKFGEYMASGTPLVTTDRIGDCSAAVRDRGLGVLIDLRQQDETIKGTLANSLSSMQNNDTVERCREFAQNELAWKLYEPDTIRVYREITS